MKSKISVQIPTEQFLRLADFLRSNSDMRDPVEMVSAAIEYWLDNASLKPELLSKTDTRGYQWKNLFLAEGTQIRMQYKGEYFYAKIEGDKIIYGDKMFSPGKLANTIADNSSRNAWRDLWIKRPLDQEWRLAEEIRLGEKLLKEVEELPDVA